MRLLLNIAYYYISIVFLIVYSCYFDFFFVTLRAYENFIIISMLLSGLCLSFTLNNIFGLKNVSVQLILMEIN